MLLPLHNMQLLRPLWSGALPVAPGIFGYGTDTVAAARCPAPSIYKVTNLNDSGVGSLRDAVSRANTAIVFEVAGIITLASDLTITQDNISIYGETSPGDGITIRNATFRIQCNDLFVSHIAVRRSEYAAQTGDCITIDGPANNIVLKNLSLSWGTDELLGFYSALNTITNVTIWNCLLFQPLNYYDHGFGTLISRDDTHNVTMRGCAHSHCIARAPNLGTETTYVNNLAYNAEYGTAHMLGATPGGRKINFVGNHAITGANTINPGSNLASRRALYIENTVPTDSEVYAYDNRCLDYNPAIHWQSVRVQPPNTSTDYRVLSPPLALPDGYAPFDSVNVKQHIINNCGKKPWERDAIDTQAIVEIENETGAWLDYTDDLPSASSFPSITPRERELTLPNKLFDIGDTGYTNLELYIFNREFDGYAQTSSVVTPTTSTMPTTISMFPNVGGDSAYQNIDEGTATPDTSDYTEGDDENESIEFGATVSVDVLLASVIKALVYHRGISGAEVPGADVALYVNDILRTVVPVNLDTSASFKSGKITIGADPPITKYDNIDIRFTYLESGTGKQEPLPGD